MGYRAGIGPGLEAHGLMPRDPHVVCDGCGRIATIYTKRGDVAQWMLKRRSPPGWWSGERERFIDEAAGDERTTADVATDCIERGDHMEKHDG